MRLGNGATSLLKRLPLRCSIGMDRAGDARRKSRLTIWQGRPITSRAGAMGLMQLMPATWASMRSALGLGGDPYQPRDNILAGTAYLRAMYDRFGYPGLFGAYNAGPGRYGASVNAGRSLPDETRTISTRSRGQRRNGQIATKGDEIRLNCRARPACLWC
jgi:hypothetical protein